MYPVFNDNQPITSGIDNNSKRTSLNVISEAPEPNIIGNEDSDDDEIDTKNNETAISNNQQPLSRNEEVKINRQFHGKSSAIRNNNGGAPTPNPHTTSGEVDINDDDADDNDDDDDKS